MTLPASGTITMANFNTELGVATTTNRSMSSIYSATKTGQQSYLMNAYYSKAYYQQNTAGNCNNANCTVVATANCGNIQCVNCARAAINCTNCDATSYIQSNCNCACTYNCTVTAQYSYNCNCDCACVVCDCACNC